MLCLVIHLQLNHLAHSVIRMQKNHTIILMDPENLLLKMQYSLPIFFFKKKSNLETKNNSEFPKPKRGIANIIFIGERITCFLLK